MIRGKAALLERINIAIKKKWFQNGSGIQGFQAAPEIDMSSPATYNGTRISNNHSQAVIERLEQRIESVEQVNEELLQFVDFLVESLPDLIINMLKVNDKDRGETIEEKNKTDNCGEAIKTYSHYKKIYPHPTRRERDVLVLLEKGLCAKEIAKKLFISETTVITHKKNLKEKYNAKNTVELISKTAFILSDPHPTYAGE